MEREKLKEARYTKGWSQEEASETIGVTRTTFSQWERGTCDPYPIHVHRLCEAFGKTAAELDLEKKKPNRKLKRERELRGWSQSKLGELIGTTDQVVNRWENGLHKPNRYFQAQLCHVFGKNGEELGFMDSEQVEEVAEEASPAEGSSLSTPLQGIIGGERELEEPIMDQLHSQSINERLDAAESLINLAWEAWFASRPRRAAEEIRAFLPGLERMLSILNLSKYALRIKELVMRCHGLLGLICLDALQNDTALFHFLQAHIYAESLRDVNETVTYLALIGDVLRRQDQKTKAIERMETARGQAMKANNATRGYVLELLAYTYGDVGREVDFENAIAEATDLLGRREEGRDGVKKEFIPFEIYEIQGKVKRDLGKPLEALSYLDRAKQALLHEEFVTPRWYAVVEISKGQALCDAGDLQTGVPVVSRGFLQAYQCQSPRQMNRVRKLLKKLESGPLKRDVQVATLRELVSDTYLRLDAENK